LPRSQGMAISPCLPEWPPGAFAIRSQRNRRNLTEADILRCIETLDKRKTKAEAARENGAMSGTTQAPAGASVPPVKSARKTAELLGISPRQVERARTILDHGSEEVKQAVGPTLASTLCGWW
jgi:ParB family chromosome partitioning protein